MKYSITHTGTDWLLKIWEPAPIEGGRELPFLYKIKLRFNSESAALAVLEHYKTIYSGVSYGGASGLSELVAV
ncbi:MAG: hypothetical protein Fur0046_29030 [Cyanobacteria bacterium J069]